MESILRIQPDDIEIMYEKENMIGEVRILMPKDKNAPRSPDLRAFYVEFIDGAHTKWHKHDGSQILIGKEGHGFVEQEGGEAKDILPGDQIYIPKAIRHRHGAKNGQNMTHLAITTGETIWEED